MHFGRLTVQFVTKVRRFCANVSRVSARSYTKLHESRLNLFVSVPPELAPPVLAGAVANVKRLARALGRKSNCAEKRSMLFLPADDLEVVLDESRGWIDEAARQLASRRCEDQKDDLAFDDAFCGQERRRRLCRGPSAFPLRRGRAKLPSSIPPMTTSLLASRSASWRLPNSWTPPP